MIVTFMVDAFGSRLATNDAAVALFGGGLSPSLRQLSQYEGMVTAVLDKNNVVAAQIERGPIVIDPNGDGEFTDAEIGPLALAEPLNAADVAALFGLPLLPPVITPGQVIAERVRRLAAGFDFNFGDERGIHRIGTTDADLAGWDEVTTLAQAMNSLGANVPLTVVTDTGPCQVTPQEWMSVLVAAAQFRQPIWAASFVLQAMDPIPLDFNDDKYWK